MPDRPRPVVRLKPKADAHAIRQGLAWYHDSDVVLDRRTRSLVPGSIATLEDADRRQIATVAVNPSVRLAVRVLDLNPNATINVDWLVQRLQYALDLRRQIYPTPFYRWCHAEGDRLSGLIIDRFGDHVVVQMNAAWIDAMSSDLVQAIQSVAEDVKTVIANGSSRSRAQEGLQLSTMALAGTMPENPVPVEMNGAVYLADLAHGQKTGLYFDQRDNHKYFSVLSAGVDVLDVFSHVGGFGLAALAGGAHSVLAVDSSGPALSLAEEGASQMSSSMKFDTRLGDAFGVMAQLAEEGRTFGAVACDPPAFAPNRKSLGQGLRAYERVARGAAALVRDGGYLVLCSCSHAAELSKFQAASQRGILRAGRKAQLIHTGFAGPDHPMAAGAGQGYLKALFYRIGQ